MQVVSVRVAIKLVVAGLSCALLSVAAPVMAQTAFPNQSLRMIIPFPPGGGVDSTGRLLADRLSAALGQTVVVENRTGANGQVGVQAVASAAPDGYTMLYTSDSPLTVLPVAEPQNVKYDVLRDLLPITNVGVIHVGIAVPISLGVNDFRSLRTRLASEPDKHSFGSQGVGTVGHLAGSYLVSLIAPKTTHVPYRGSGQALPDLIAGRLAFMVISLRELESHERGGKLKGLATFARERVPGFNYPTIAEAGLPEMLKYDFHTATILLTPKATPAAVAQRLNREVVAILKDPDVVKRFAAAGVTTAPQGLAEAQTDFERKVKSIPVLFKSLGIDGK